MGQEGSEEKKQRKRSRTAEQVGQTLNVDLCFVPVAHEPQGKLPAVSGSSGRLVVEQTQPQTETPWPGYIFDNPELSYTEAMEAYVEMTRDRLIHGQRENVAKTGRKAEKQALRRAEEALREERYQVRERRKQEDMDWRAFRKQIRDRRSADPTLGKMERHKQKVFHQALHQQWSHALEQRRTCLQNRSQEDVDWHTQRRTFAKPQTASVWLAILAITDNCTRQCLGLPLFVAGVNVTSEMVVQALREALPTELQFLISDQGSHFRTNVFAQLAQEKQFVWVPVARHRPESNGIAERFVRTLKEWLASKSWNASQQLLDLLAHFLSEYNHRPHQGLPIPGLSPNEFAKRLWLF